MLRRCRSRGMLGRSCAREEILMFLPDAKDMTFFLWNRGIEWPGGISLSLEETQCRRKCIVGGVEWVKASQRSCRDKIKLNARRDNSTSSGGGSMLM
ncbi:hypothetical protein V6N12_064887 [Hibiscus sabdariffa]|uniref:Uncharacterized protein n=1 Tax=Hibiscus sabdariffa TaxID=183260 RepID=A0ABR2G754_9ROSI